MSHLKITDRRLHAEEFAVLPEVDAREELVRGDIVREPLPAFGHGAIAIRIGSLLDAWARRPERMEGPPQGPGRVVDHCGFVLARDPDTVRGPDVAFVSRERLATGLTDGPFFEGAPDLAVEVLSPSNRPREIARKAREYLRAGGRRVWVVDPDRETVTVYSSGRPPRVLRAQDTLDDGEVLPGFSVTVAALFESVRSRPGEPWTPGP